MKITSTFKNPVDWGEVLRGLLFGALTFIFCLLIFSLKGSINGLMFVLSIAGALIVGWFTGFWNELWLRPRTVEIREEGLLLIFFPWRGKKLIEWSDVLSLNILLEDPKKYNYKVGRDGMLWSRKKRVFALFWPIANEVREAYKVRIGEYPPLTFDK